MCQVSTHGHRRTATGLKILVVHANDFRKNYPTQKYKLLDSLPLSVKIARTSRELDKDLSSFSRFRFSGGGISEYSIGFSVLKTKCMFFPIMREPIRLLRYCFIFQVALYWIKLGLLFLYRKPVSGFLYLFGYYNLHENKAS